MERILIPAEEPVTVEAIPAKSFDNLWIKSVVINAPSTTAGRITVECIPYNAETGELGSGSQMVSVSTDRLWDAVEAIPEVAQALVDILSAVVPLRTWIAAEQLAAEQPAE